MTNFRKVLHEKGFTGASFAKICGVGRSIIYKYMCGNRPLSYKIASRFALLLGVEPEEIMEDR